MRAQSDCAQTSCRLTRPVMQWATFSPMFDAPCSRTPDRRRPVSQDPANLSGRCGKRQAGGRRSTRILTAGQSSAGEANVPAPSLALDSGRDDAYDVPMNTGFWHAVVLFLVVDFPLCGSAQSVAPNLTLTPGLVRPLSKTTICTTQWGQDARLLIAKSVFGGWASWADERSPSVC